MITCDKCAYCTPTPGGSLYCALTGHFVSNLGCGHGEPINKPKTNADKIRSMSDEELADVLLAHECKGCDWDGGFCRNAEIACRKEILVWLKEEVSE